MCDQNHVHVCVRVSRRYCTRHCCQVLERARKSPTHFLTAPPPSLESLLRRRLIQETDPSPPNHACCALKMPCECSNSVTDKGAALLARSLYENTTVKSLSIGGNRLTDYTARTMANLLRSGSCSLTALNLSNAPPTARSVSHFESISKVIGR